VPRTASNTVAVANLKVLSRFMVISFNNRAGCLPEGNPEAARP
jgi:hypothetical protein